ncbi:permease [Acinetobacter sp. ANC 4216]|uniref:permease n=1 Tax=Acinetobacter sp. ANC 4216 TaxID=2529840 RepID=UPI00103D9FD7|nr:permease [Acinetobacter sp. ANC 4216]TCB70548.1 permease [Acinetobacter sp. ANC 4216]
MESIIAIFAWLNDVLLKMTWLSDGVRWLVENIFGLSVATRLGGSIHFFIYDVIKIFILLSVLIYTLSYIQSYFPPERTRQILGGMTGIKANIMGALLGTITPFCSCSSIPLFIGFTRAGLPVGVTFSFLISSPLVDLASIILLASIFNWKIAMVYVLLGLVLAVLGGSLISYLKMEKYVAEFVTHHQATQGEDEDFSMTVKERRAFAWEQVVEIFSKVWMYVLIGVGIGAAIHNWIPEQWISTLLGQEHWYSVLIATIVGIPMYADIFGTLPIAEALVAKGVGLGTVLAFMMAVTALSLPSLILLKQVVQTRLLSLFVAIIFVGILIIGYSLNTLGNWFL